MVLSNKMTLLIAAILVVSINIIISMVPKLKTFDLKNTLETIALVIPIIGTVTQAKKEKQEKGPNSLRPVYKLNVSFEGALYGGAIGGILSGAIIAIIVYLQKDKPPLSICLKIVPLCACIGCLFGVLIYVGRMLFTRVFTTNDYWPDFFGCLMGCILAGTFSGMLAMLLFGSEKPHFIGFAQIALASVIGTLGLVLGSLSYEYEGKLKYILFSLTIALILSAFIPVFGFLLINDQTIQRYQDGLPVEYTRTNEYLIKTGAILGVINGFIFGLVISFTILFYKFWRFADKQRSPKNGH